MKLHVITIGQPKPPYAKAGWHEYLARLQRYHTVRVTHLADKYAGDATAILQHAGKAYVVALTIDGQRFDSPGLARWLEDRATAGQELCFVVGGPHGLPTPVIAHSQLQWSFSPLTFPHDLAMVILAESLYRASTIAANHPYHKA